MSIEKQNNPLKWDFRSYNQLKPEPSKKFWNKPNLIIFPLSILFMGVFFQHSFLLQENIFKYLYITNALDKKTQLVDKDIAYKHDKEGHVYIDQADQIKKFNEYINLNKKNNTLNMYDSKSKDILDNYVVRSDVELSLKIIDIMQKENIYVDLIKYQLHPMVDKNNHQYLAHNSILIGMEKLLSLSDEKIDQTSFTLLNDIIDNPMTNEDMKKQYAALGIKHIEKQAIFIKNKYNHQKTDSLINKVLDSTLLKQSLTGDYYNSYSKYRAIMGENNSKIEKDWNALIK